LPTTAERDVRGEGEERRGKGQTRKEEGRKTGDARKKEGRKERMQQRYYAVTRAMPAFDYARYALLFVHQEHTNNNT
jgi:hypothetical protein